MEKRPDYIGYSIWNLVDFQVDGRGDSKPNLNQKGNVDRGSSEERDLLLLSGSLVGHSDDSYCRGRLDEKGGNL